MKQKFKKISILIFILTLTFSVFAGNILAAAPAGNGNLTIDSIGSTKQSFENRTINAYNLFYITSVNGTNVTYEVNPDYRDILVNVTGIDVSGRSNAEINAELVAFIETQNPSNSDAVKNFGTSLWNAIKQAGNITPSASQTGGTNARSIPFANLNFGYYLLVDENNVAYRDNMTTTFPLLYSFHQANDTLYLKSDLPTIEKSIAGEKGTAAEIGAIVDYTIRGNVPNTTGFKTYTYTLADTMSEGLTFNDDITITIGGTDITAHTTLTTPNVPYTFTLSVPMLDGGGNPLYTPGDDIVVSYSATVNQKAPIGELGSDNVAQLIYSNNLGNETETDLYAIPDPITVYTFGLNVYKVNEMNAPLNGAVFTLDGNVSGDAHYNSWVNNTGTDGTFIFNGLKTGTTYRLTETAHPSGYKPLSTPITFDLSAAYGPDGSLTAIQTNHVSGGYNITVNPTDSGYLDLTVQNTPGFRLPNTGGIGTMLPMLFGLILIGAAVALLIFAQKNKRDRS